VHRFTRRLRGDARNLPGENADWRPGRVYFLTLLEPPRDDGYSGPYRQVGHPLPGDSMKASHDRFSQYGSNAR
jgi:hypothetical protein